MKTKSELLCVLKKKTTQLQQSDLDYTENKTQSFNLPPQVNKSESLQNKTVFQNLITQSLRNSSWQNHGYKHLNKQPTPRFPVNYS